MDETWHSLLSRQQAISIVTNAIHGTCLEQKLIGYPGNAASTKQNCYRNCRDSGFPEVDSVRGCRLLRLQSSSDKRTRQKQQTQFPHDAPICLLVNDQVGSLALEQNDPQWIPSCAEAQTSWMAKPTRRFENRAELLKKTGLWWKSLVFGQCWLTAMVSHKFGRYIWRWKWTTWLISTRSMRFEDGSNLRRFNNTNGSRIV